MSVFARALRAGEGKKVRRLAELVPLINELEPAVEALSDQDLAHRTVEFKERVERGESLDDLLNRRLRHRPGSGLEDPRPAPLRRAAHGGHGPALRMDRRDEDREGKTLVSTLPVYLNALGGEGVHLVTVNDYLARRDADWKWVRSTGSSV